MSSALHPECPLNDDSFGPSSTSSSSSEDLATGEQKKDVPEIDVQLTTTASETPTSIEAPSTATASETPTIIEAPSTTGITLDQFHYFPDLPGELKVKVWEFTFPSPRIIPLQSWGYSLKVTSDLKLPSVPISLKVHKESRDETLKSYELLTQSRYNEHRQVYVSFKRDIFCFLGYQLKIETPVISNNAPADAMALTQSTLR